MDLISRKEALEQGLKRYFTGKPCRNGHICERYTSVFQCVECGKIGTIKYMKQNPDKVAKWDKATYERDKEKYLTSQRNYYGRTRDIQLANAKNYRESHKSECIAWNAKRRCDKLQRTPKWADLTKIKHIYKERELISRKTGIPHVVDHIIPLRGKLVSGLHVPENLQVITKDENSRKSFKFNPEKYNA